MMPGFRLRRFALARSFPTPAALAIVALVAGGACGSPEQLPEPVDPPEDTLPQCEEEELGILSVDTEQGCAFPLPDGWTEGVDVDCGSLAVPVFHGGMSPGDTTQDEDTPSDASSETIMVPYARFRVVDGTGASVAENTTLLEILGGPGQSWTDFVDKYTKERVAQLGRDVLVVEHRGAAGSDPVVQCPDLDFGALMTSDDPLGDARAGALQCCRSNRASGVPLPAFHAGEMAEDIESVRAHLDIPSLTVYGTSYGTRIAQAYAQKHPDRVEAMLLDSVVAPHLPARGHAIAPIWETLQRIFAACASEDGAGECGSRFPDLEERFLDTAFDLAAAPLPAGEGLMLDDRLFVTLTIVLAFSTPEHVPLMVHTINNQAEQGSFPAFIQRRLPNFLRSAFQASGPVSGIFYSATCADAGGVSSAEIDAQTEAIPQDLRRGIRFLLDLSAAACDGWWFASLDDDLLTRLAGATMPTLAFGGTFDTLTTIELGRAAVDAFTEKTFVERARSGHPVLGNDGACADALAFAFLADPSAPLDTACAASSKVDFSLNILDLFRT